MDWEQKQFQKTQNRIKRKDKRAISKRDPFAKILEDDRYHQRIKDVDRYKRERVYLNKLNIEDDDE